MFANGKTPAKKVALYIIGDSFTEAQRVGAEDFVAEKYQYAHWGTKLHLKLDTAYTNIIILETVERKVREHFIAPISNVLPDTATYVTIPEDTRLVSRLDQLFLSVATEERLATILFQYDIILKIKELKSALNYHLFDRTDPKVDVSQDGEVLSYVEETESGLVTSSFNEVKNWEVDSLVSVINYDQKFLKDLGFDAVYLAIIPSKTSILMPEFGTYNHLLERVEGHPQLSLASISVYQDFKEMKENPYLLGDSHWSCAGQYRWLQKANQLLFSEIGLQ